MHGLVLQGVPMKRVFVGQLPLEERYVSIEIRNVNFLGCEFVTSFYCRDYDDKSFQCHPNRLSALPATKHHDVFQHRHFQYLRSSRLPKHHPFPSTDPILLRRRYPPRKHGKQQPRHTLHRPRNPLLQPRHPIHRTQYNVLWS